MTSNDAAMGHAHAAGSSTDIFRRAMNATVKPAPAASASTGTTPNLGSSKAKIGPLKRQLSA
jgi:hypothetical protein